MQKQPQKTCRVVAALIVDGERFLVARRPANKARGGLWEFVGGKVEEGETEEEALCRECREEMAIEVAADKLFFSLTHAYPDLTVTLRVYCAHIVSGEIRLLEHQEARFVTLQEAQKLPFCPADDPVLEAMCAAKEELFSGI